ncbi:PX domain-containing protein 1-like [Toxotes jaculatrix]|uniref:PX domain-containing protein 1-like n=1 Tax=Toxotes jaculatrix TaxID=941984 RepID=UPI001B3AC6AE|nr:PX domain-containing protein 1-like [Toxotes jaculatrix]
MMKRLVDGFPDDRETLSCRLPSGADLRSDPEVKAVEMNKLLDTIIRLPHKFSQSEAVLAFFELSAEDQVFRPEEDQMFQQEKSRQEEDGTFRQEVDQITTRDEDQDLNVFQSPVALSEIMRSNGFCLANTETILFDLTPPTQDITQSDDSTSRRDDGQAGEEAELETQDSLAPLPHPIHLTSHLLLTWTQETDILD